MKATLCIIMVAGCACWIWMCLLCLRVIPFSIGQLYASTILASSLTYSASPIFFEFCVEIVYPVPEGIVGGFLTCVYNTFGMIFLFLFYIPEIGEYSFDFYQIFRFVSIHILLIFLLYRSNLSFHSNRFFSCLNRYLPFFVHFAVATI